MPLTICIPKQNLSETLSDKSSSISITISNIRILHMPKVFKLKKNSTLRSPHTHDFLHFPECLHRMGLKFKLKIIEPKKQQIFRLQKCNFHPQLSRLSAALHSALSKMPCGFFFDGLDIWGNFIFFLLLMF